MTLSGSWWKQWTTYICPLYDSVEHAKKIERKVWESDVTESNLEAVIISIDASGTEEESEDDDDAGDEKEGEDIFGVQPLEWN
ncbi:hypothetical protein HPB47_007122 [Ixodes persulcatus]|uniref:Uncharacterized protein n=1 Tax=Ixodes persulcatus TaxID=34615 RepID=A0AC60P8F8_IXOPE|nr:hypothetical protein HPB47_007122 [Ixodes persulcatus]